MALNVCGLVSKLRYDILPAYVKNFDVIAMCETKITNIPADEFPDFDIFSMKQKSKCHGLALFVKSGLFSHTKHIKNTKSKCVLWVALGLDKNITSVIVGAVYIPGENSIHVDKNDYDVICEDIVLLYSMYDCPFVLLGDFNSRTSTLNDFSSQTDIVSFLEKSGITTERYNCDKKRDSNGIDLIKLCNDLNFGIVNGRFGSDQKIGQFTCIKPGNRGQSTVDYAITSSSLFPYILDFRIDTFDSCMSDIHLPLCMDLNLKKQAEHFQEETSQKYSTIKFKSSWKAEKKVEYVAAFSQNSISQFREKILNQTLWGTDQENMDNLSNDLAAILVEPAKQVGLCKRVKLSKPKPRLNPLKPWFNDACERNRRIYFKAKHNIWTAKTPTKKQDCIDEMRQKGKLYKTFISHRQKVFNKHLHKNLRDSRKRNTKEYWQILKKCEGQAKKDPKVSIGSFERHFTQLSSGYGENSGTPDFDPRKIGHAINQEINVDFTFQEVSQSIKNLKNDKSEGIDLIKNEYLKSCPVEVIQLAVILFNLVLRTGIVPTEWSIGLIVAIFKKKGSQHDPNNYRGITLLSCLGKLFTLCISVRLNLYATRRGLIGEEQAAFRELYSTFDHIFVLNELIQLYLHDRDRLYGCYVDYKQAFDRILRVSLWRKLIASEINGNIITVIYNMYKNAKSCVKQQTLISGFFACNIGVRQGENLSPFLFAIFLNDFELFLSRRYNGLTKINRLGDILGDDDVQFFINMFILLYADDTLILAETPAQLQLAMHAASDYCTLWDLHINQSKTKVVIFSRGKVKTNYHFKFGEIDIETVGSYEYLGIVFNFNGRLTHAISERIVPARKAMFGLNSKAVRLQLPPDIQIDLFEKMVVPICLYGSEIWGYANIEPVEVFYRKFIKRVLGLQKSTPNCITYGEIGKYPLAVEIQKRMLLFWVNISEGKQTKLSSIMYNLIYALHVNGTYDSPWLMKIKSIICNSGNPFLWYQQNQCVPKKLWLNTILQQLKDQYLQEWNNEIWQNRKCVIYRIIKTQHGFEDYLVKLSFLQRRSLCKFRTGNHRLPIAESRYRNTVIDITCNLCDSDETCDEFHVLFTCKYFEEKRKLFLKPYYYTRPSSMKMCSLFNSSYKQLTNLAKFTEYIMSKF